MKIGRGYLIAAIFAALLLFLLSPWRADARRLNVLLIVADTLRADHLGSYGYQKNTSPRLDRFAEQAVLFENAIAQGPWTKPSMGSLFTSVYPHNHRAMSGLYETLPGEVLTLAEVLKKNGYRTMGVQTNPSLSKPFHFDQGFMEYEELFADDLKDVLTLRRADEVVDHFFDWADKRPKTMFFAYLHFMDCHLPFHPPKEHRLIFEPAYEGKLQPDRISYEERLTLIGSGGEISGADKAHITALYDASIHYLDSQIGRLIDGLGERRLLDRTLIVIVSDHGEEFFEHGGFDHGQSLYNELLHVPLILRDPGMGGKGVRVRQPIRLIDVFPTILSFLDLTPPSNILGTDLRPQISGPETDLGLASYSEGVSFHKTPPGRSAKNFISVQKGGYKLIQQTIHGKRSLEFYDLRADPAERSPLGEAHGLTEEYETLLKKHQTLGEDLRSIELKESEEAEILERLKSLGYLH